VGQPEELSEYLRKIAPETNSETLFNNISENVKQIASELKLTESGKRFTLIGNSIRSYYSINLNKIWGDALIPEIVIGPRCYQNKHELKAFLKASGLYNTKVRISSIPIR
jgi:hypothetical protein